jgi:hypothetical protein
MNQVRSHDSKRPALTFRMWDDSLGLRAHFDCAITGEGDEKRFEWRCREQPRFLLDGGSGGREEAKFSALHFFRGSWGFCARWAQPGRITRTNHCAGQSAPEYNQGR